MADGNRIEDEVEAAARRAHLVGVPRDDDVMGAQPAGLLALAWRGRDHRDMSAERRGELDAEVAQAAEAGDGDLLPRPDIVRILPERRPGGDAGAKEWRSAGRVEGIGHADDEMLARDTV